MGILIDSSIIIAAERGQLDLRRALAEFGTERVALSSVTAAELLHGVYRADAAHRARREAFVSAVITDFEVVPFGLPVARTYARLIAERSTAGRPIAPHDLIIAATALTMNSRIVTRDLRSFPTISGLDVAQW